MRCQAQEEVSHAMKFYNYIFERGGKVTMKPIEGPATTWKSPLAVFQETFKHEQHVSRLIDNLVNISVKEKDHATNSFLKWFVDEQVEEEASADEIVQQLKLVGNQGHGIFMLDREMGQRVFTPPAEEA
jgi:ferritin